MIEKDFVCLRKISTLNKWLEKKKYNVEEMWGRVDEIIVKTLIAALPVRGIIITPASLRTTSHSPVSNCWALTYFWTTS